MSQRNRFNRTGLPFFLLCASCVSAGAETPAPSSTTLTGSLSEVGGVRVLRLWGAPRERGYAQGRLLGRDIVALADRYITECPRLTGPDGFDHMTAVCKELMTLQPAYESELRGLLEGIQAEFGGPAVLHSLGRPFDYNDLLAFNCLPDLIRIGCSSFAVWGPLTPDGHTLAGRNLDWFADSVKLGHSQIITVQSPDPQRGTLGWASVTWPGMIICLTGMNSDGVTVSLHDAAFGQSWKRPGSTPRGFTLREAIESAHATSAAKDIARVLRARHCVTGNNIPVALPYDGKSPASLVFEYDGDTAVDGGATLRLPDGESAGDKSGRYFEICTNDYRTRGTPLPVGRYPALARRIHDFWSQSHTLAIADAKSLLGLVEMNFVCVTYQSVIFEPNARRMHVAFGRPHKPAPARYVTFDVAALLANPTPPRPPQTIASP